MESHDIGDTSTALLDETIGANFARTAAEHGDREALVEAASGRRWTYAELDRDVDALARGLLAAGLQVGDRVGIWAPNCAEWTIAQYATAKVGVICVNVNPAYRTHEFSYAVNQSGLRLLISAESFKTSDYRAMVEETAPRNAGLERVVYIGTDNVAAGRDAGAQMKKALPGGGKAMLFVGTMDADNARERVQGIREALAGGNIEILDVRTDDSDFARAKRNAEDTLSRYADLGLMVGLWAYNTPQIYQAVKQAGREKNVKIVGFDEDALTLRGVADGTIHSTVVQQPFEFGYQSMKGMAKYLAGDKSWIPANKQIIVPTRVIDSGNVAEFQGFMKQILRPS